MPIPAFQQIIRPLLVFAEDGSEKSRQGAVQALASHFNLTEEERDQLLPSGTQALFTNRVNWARTYLDKAGALRRTRRAHFVITDRGKKLLAEHPDYINVKILRQFPEFVAFHAPKAAGENDAPAVSEMLNIRGIGVCAERGRKVVDPPTLLIPTLVVSGSLAMMGVIAATGRYPSPTRSGYVLVRYNLDVLTSRI